MMELGPDAGAYHRDGKRGQMVEGGAHRDGVCVVAVVDDDESTGQLKQLAAQAREGYTGGALRHLFDGSLQGDPDRDRCQGVGEIVGLAERERGVTCAVRRRHRGLDRATVPSPLEREDVAA